MPTRSLSTLHAGMPDIFAGLFVAVMTATFAASFSLLIYTGPLEQHAGAGMMLILLGSVVVGIWTVSRCFYPGLIAVPQDRIAPILAFMAAGITVQMPGRPTETIFATVLAGIMLATVVTGMACYLLGRRKMGNLVRFIPYPVVGGFLAGAGWLLASGSVAVMTGRPFELNTLHLQIINGDLDPWIPCACFGLLLFFATHWLCRFYVLPLMLLFGMVAFYVWLVASGATLDEARGNGLLLVSMRYDPIASLAGLARITGADWGVLLTQLPYVGAIALTSIISVLLNSSAIEIETEEEADFNEELKTIGAANMTAALAGGIVGFHSLSLTRLAREIGARGRLAGWVTVVGVFCMLISGPAFIGYIPKYFLGGVLLYLGLRFLYEWLVEGWGRMPRGDYFAVVIILMVVATVGYLEGVFAGIIGATLLFVYNYSRVHAVSAIFSGAQTRSNVDRSLRAERILRAHGGCIHLLRLQGFLFFGSANHVLVGVRNRFADTSQPRLSHVVLDFERVYGLDSSAALSLVRLLQFTAKNGVQVVFCGLSPGLADTLRASDFNLDQTPGLLLEPDRDHALQRCEESVLLEHPADDARDMVRLARQLRDLWPPESDPETLMPHLDHRDFDSGTFILRKGEPSNELFFIESGRVAALLELGNGRSVRLRVMGPGAVVGELGLYLNEPRTAHVRVEENCRAWVLTREKLRHMEAADPRTAANLHLFMTRLLAERMVAQSKMLQTMLE